MVRYLFQKIDLLNPSLNCFVKFTLSLVDKVTIGTCNLASVISNFAESPALRKMQSSIQFNFVFLQSYFHYFHYFQVALYLND